MLESFTRGIIWLFLSAVIIYLLPNIFEAVAIVAEAALFVLVGYFIIGLLYEAIVESKQEEGENNHD